MSIPICVFLCVSVGFCGISSGCLSDFLCIPIWDGNRNDFKPMGIPTCGFLCVFPYGMGIGMTLSLWVFPHVGFCMFLWVFRQKSCGNGF